MDEVSGGVKSNLVIGPFGSSLKVSDYRSHGVPLVFVRDIRAADFTAPSHYVSAEKANELQAHTALPGDVLITKMGDPPGDSCVYNGHSPAIITADCIRLRMSRDIDARYVCFAMQSPAVREQVLKITSGVAQKKVSLGRFRVGISIPVPPLDEQQRIAEILEDYHSRLDVANRGLSSVQLRVQALRSAVLDEVHVGADTVALAEVAAIQGGIQKQPKRKPILNRYPFLRVANVTSAGLDLEEVHEIELFEGELDRLRLQSGDLLVVEGNGSASQIGRAALWDGSIRDCVHQNHLIRVRAGGRLLPEYLEIVWNSPSTRRRLSSLASSTSGLHTLSVSKLKGLPIPVPSIPDQRTVIQRVSQLRHRADRLKAVTSVAGIRSSALRRTLLAAALSGQLTRVHEVREVVEGMASV